jgi:hypothetical protein
MCYLRYGKTGLAHFNYSGKEFTPGNIFPLVAWQTK